MTPGDESTPSLDAVCALPEDALADRLALIRRDVLPLARRRAVSRWRPRSRNSTTRA